MNKTALVAAVALGVSAFAPPVLSQALGLPSAQDRRLSAEADPNRGRFLAFGGMHGDLRVSCVQCHGLEGVGNSSGAFPRLTDQSAWYLYKTLQDYAGGLRRNEIMSPIAGLLTPQQMQDVAAYYASVKDAPYPQPPESDVRDLQIGGAIAAVGIPEQGVPGCDGCHGPNGIGKPPIYPYLAGQYAPYTEYQLLLWKKGQRDGDPMNIMELIAKAMSPEQIRAVSLFYASVRPAEVTPEDRRAPIASTSDPNLSAKPSERAPTGAVRSPEPGGGSAVAPAGPVDEPSPGPPYLTQPQQTRSGPNVTTTGRSPDPSR
jgi:cytochrome c553